MLSAREVLCNEYMTLCAPSGCAGSPDVVAYLLSSKPLNVISLAGCDITAVNEGATETQRDSLFTALLSILKAIAVNELCLDDYISPTESQVTSLASFCADHSSLSRISLHGVPMSEQNLTQLLDAVHRNPRLTRVVIAKNDADWRQQQIDDAIRRRAQSGPDGRATARDFSGDVIAALRAPASSATSFDVSAALLAVAKGINSPPTRDSPVTTRYFLYGYLALGRLCATHDLSGAFASPTANAALVFSRYALAFATYRDGHQYAVSADCASKNVAADNAEALLVHLAHQSSIESQHPCASCGTLVAADSAYADGRLAKFAQSFADDVSSYYSRIGMRSDVADSRRVSELIPAEEAEKHGRSDSLWSHPSSYDTERLGWYSRGSAGVPTTTAGQAISCVLAVLSTLLDSDEMYAAAEQVIFSSGPQLLDATLLPANKAAAACRRVPFSQAEKLLWSLANIRLCSESCAVVTARLAAAAACGFSTSVQPVSTAQELLNEMTASFDDAGLARGALAPLLDVPDLVYCTLGPDELRRAACATDVPREVHRTVAEVALNVAMASAARTAVSRAPDGTCLNALFFSLVLEMIDVEAEKLVGDTPNIDELRAQLTSLVSPLCRVSRRQFLRCTVRDVVCTLAINLAEASNTASPHIPTCVWRHCDDALPWPSWRPTRHKHRQHLNPELGWWNQLQPSRALWLFVKHVANATGSHCVLTAVRWHHAYGVFLTDSVVDPGSAAAWEPSRRTSSAVTSTAHSFRLVLGSNEELETSGYHTRAAVVVAARMAPAADDKVMSPEFELLIDGARVWVPSSVIDEGGTRYGIWAVARPRVEHIPLLLAACGLNASCQKTLDDAAVDMMIASRYTAVNDQSRRREGGESIDPPLQIRWAPSMHTVAAHLMDVAARASFAELFLIAWVTTSPPPDEPAAALLRYDDLGNTSVLRQYFDNAIESVPSRTATSIVDEELCHRSMTRWAALCEYRRGNAHHVVPLFWAVLLDNQFGRGWALAAARFCQHCFGAGVDTTSLHPLWSMQHAVRNTETSQETVPEARRWPPLRTFFADERTSLLANCRYDGDLVSSLMPHCRQFAADTRERSEFDNHVKTHLGVAGTVETVADEQGPDDQAVPLLFDVMWDAIAASQAFEDGLAPTLLIDVGHTLDVRAVDVDLCFLAPKEREGRSDEYDGEKARWRRGLSARIEFARSSDGVLFNVVGLDEVLCSTAYHEDVAARDELYLLRCTRVTIPLLGASAGPHRYWRLRFLFDDVSPLGAASDAASKRSRDILSDSSTAGVAVADCPVPCVRKIFLRYMPQRLIDSFAAPLGVENYWLYSRGTDRTLHVVNLTTDPKGSTSMAWDVRPASSVAIDALGAGSITAVLPATSGVAMALTVDGGCGEIDPWSFALRKPFVRLSEHPFTAILPPPFNAVIDVAVQLRRRSESVASWSSGSTTPTILISGHMFMVQDFAQGLTVVTPRSLQYLCGRLCGEIDANENFSNQTLADGPVRAFPFSEVDFAIAVPLPTQQCIAQLRDTGTLWYFVSDSRYVPWLLPYAEDVMSSAAAQANNVRLLQKLLDAPHTSSRSMTIGKNRTLRRTVPHAWFQAPTMLLVHSPAKSLVVPVNVSACIASCPALTAVLVRDGDVREGSFRCMREWLPPNISTLLHVSAIAISPKAAIPPSAIAMTGPVRAELLDSADSDSAASQSGADDDDTANLSKPRKAAARIADQQRFPSPSASIAYGSRLLPSAVMLTCDSSATDSRCTVPVIYWGGKTMCSLTFTLAFPAAMRAVTVVADAVGTTWTLSAAVLGSASEMEMCAVLQQGQVATGVVSASTYSTTWTLRSDLSSVAAVYSVVLWPHTTRGINGYARPPPPLRWVPLGDARGPHTLLACGARVALKPEVDVSSVSRKLQLSLSSTLSEEYSMRLTASVLTMGGMLEVFFPNRPVSAVELLSLSSHSPRRLSPATDLATPIELAQLAERRIATWVVSPSDGVAHPEAGERQRFLSHCDVVRPRLQCDYSPEAPPVITLELHPHHPSPAPPPSADVRRIALVRVESLPNRGTVYEALVVVDTLVVAESRVAVVVADTGVVPRFIEWVRPLATAVALRSERSSAIVDPSGCGALLGAPFIPSAAGVCSQAADSPGAAVSIAGLPADSFLHLSLATPQVVSLITLTVRIGCAAAELPGDMMLFEEISVRASPLDPWLQLLPLIRVATCRSIRQDDHGFTLVSFHVDLHHVEVVELLTGRAVANGDDTVRLISQLRLTFRQNTFFASNVTCDVIAADCLSPTVIPSCALASSRLARPSATVTYGGRECSCPLASILMPAVEGVLVTHHTFHRGQLYCGVTLGPPKSRLSTATAAALGLGGAYRCTPVRTAIFDVQRWDPASNSFRSVAVVQTGHFAAWDGAILCSTWRLVCLEVMFAEEDNDPSDPSLAIAAEELEFSVSFDERGHTPSFAPLVFSAQTARLKTNLAIYPPKTPLLAAHTMQPSNVRLCVIVPEDLSMTSLYLSYDFGFNAPELVRLAMRTAPMSHRLADLEIAVQCSDDGVSFTTVAIHVQEADVGSRWQGTTWSDCGTHRYWRLNCPLFRDKNVSFADDGAKARAAMKFAHAFSNIVWYTKQVTVTTGVAEHQPSHARAMNILRLFLNRDPPRTAFHMTPMPLTYGKHDRSRGYEDTNSKNASFKLLCGRVPPNVTRATSTLEEKCEVAAPDLVDPHIWHIDPREQAPAANAEFWNGVSRGESLVLRAAEVFPPVQEEKELPAVKIGAILARPFMGIPAGALAYIEYKWVHNTERLVPITTVFLTFTSSELVAPHLGTFFSPVVRALLLPAVDGSAGTTRILAAFSSRPIAFARGDLVTIPVENDEHDLEFEDVPWTMPLHRGLNLLYWDAVETFTDRLPIERYRTMLRGVLRLSNRPRQFVSRVCPGTDEPSMITFEIDSFSKEEAGDTKRPALRIPGVDCASCQVSIREDTDSTVCGLSITSSDATSELLPGAPLELFLLCPSTRAHQNDEWMTDEDPVLVLRSRDAFRPVFLNLGPEARIANALLVRDVVRVDPQSDGGVVFSEDCSVTGVLTMGATCALPFTMQVTGVTGTFEALAEGMSLVDLLATVTGRHPNDCVPGFIHSRLTHVRLCATVIAAEERAAPISFSAELHWPGFGAQGHIPVSGVLSQDSIRVSGCIPRFDAHHTALALVKANFLMAWDAMTTEGIRVTVSGTSFSSYSASALDGTPALCVPPRCDATHAIFEIAQTAKASYYFANPQSSQWAVVEGTSIGPFAGPTTAWRTTWRAATRAGKGHSVEQCNTFFVPSLMFR